jgi:hypothetical protein
MSAEATPQTTEPVVEQPAPQLSHGQKALQKLEAPPTVETPAVEPETPAVSAKAKKLAEMGFENVTTDDEAFDRLAAAYSNVKNEFGAQLQAALAEVKHTPDQPTPQPKQDAKTGKWQWEPPAVDPQLLAAYRTVDGWKPETPPEIRQAAEARQRYLDSFATKFVQDPASTLEPLLEDRFEQFWEKKFSEVTRQQQAASIQQKLFTENPWLFQSDPISGKPNLNTLSDEGKLIDQWMQEAQARGADYELSWELAMTKHRLAKAEFASKQTTQAQTAQEINEQKKRESLARASGTPNRTGSLPTPAEARTTQRNRHLTPGQRWAQHASSMGLPTN